jgi:hypothetical protein
VIEDEQKMKRWYHTGIKAKAALSLIRGDCTLPELAELSDVHPKQIPGWKEKLEISGRRLITSSGHL